MSGGRGFLSPPETLDALKTLGFNLLSLSDNHAFDLKATGIRNTIREADTRNIVHAGTGNGGHVTYIRLVIRCQKLRAV